MDTSKNSKWSVFSAVICFFVGAIILFLPDKSYQLYGWGVVACGTILALAAFLQLPSEPKKIQESKPQDQPVVNQSVVRLGFFGWVGLVIILVVVFGNLSPILLKSFVDLSWWLLIPLWLVSLFVIGVGWWLFWSNFKRWLSDHHWFFIRPPEMTATPIEKDNKLYLMVISCSGSRRNYFRDLCNMKNAEYKKFCDEQGLKFHVRYVLLEPGQELYYIGVPWIYKLKDPWYENTDDEKNPQTDPVQFLNLQQRILNYGYSIIPEMDTTDPIQVKSKLVVEGQVCDPELALYGISYFLENVQQEVITVYKRVINGLSYFKSQTQDPIGSDKSQTIKALTFEEAEINPEVQKHAQGNLVSSFFGAINQADDQTNNQTSRLNAGLKIKKSSSGDYEFEKSFLVGSSADICVERDGFEITGINVLDIDPTDEIRKAIDEKTQSKAKSAANIATAQGNLVVEDLKGKAALAFKLKDAEGDAAYLDKQAKVLRDNPFAGQVLASQTAVNIAKGANTIITEGGVPGVVANITKVMQELNKAGNSEVPKAEPDLKVDESKKKSDSKTDPKTKTKSDSKKGGK